MTFTIFHSFNSPFTGIVTLTVILINIILTKDLNQRLFLLLHNVDVANQIEVSRSQDVTIV